MKFIYITTVLVIMAFYCQSQTIIITDQESGKPLELVTLSSEKPRAFTTTNAKGQADFHLFKGSEKIEIRMLSYKVEHKSFAELEQAGFKLSMIASGVSLDELIISATRWSQNSKDVPEKITSISAKSVALQNPQTAADLLGSSGEVFIQKSQQGGGSPIIRGFSTNRLLYVVDGVRMNTAIFRSGNIQNVISLDPYATENTEVLFGPGSVIYGSDAIGGVMSFKTLTPQFSLDDKVNVRVRANFRSASANSEKTGHAAVNLGWKKWASVTSITHFDYGNLRMGSHGPDDYLSTFYVDRIDSLDVVISNEEPKLQRPTDYQQNNIMQKISFKPNDAWLFEYGFHYSETSNYDRYDRLIRTRDGLPRSAEWYYGPQKWVMNNLTITNNCDNVVYDQLTIRLAHQLFEESRIDRDFNDSERRIRDEKVNAYSMNFDFNKYIGSRHKLFYGLEAVVDEVESTGTDTEITTGVSVEGPSRYPQSTWSSYAAYINYQFKLSEKTLLQAGARYNQYNLDAEFDTTFFPFPYTNASINDGALTGSLGFVYNPSEKWSLSINASSGFRAPNVDDMGKVFDSEPGSVVVPNPDLEAENAYNIEAGIAKVFGDILKVDVTAYYTLLENAMVRRDYTLNGQDSIVYDGELSQVQAVQNAASATVYGIQAGFELKLPGGFGLSSRFNYQIGEEELDDGTESPLRHAAPFFGVSHLSYSIKNLILDLNVMYSDAMNYNDLPEEAKGTDYLYAKDKNGDPYSPSWYTLNFKMLFNVTDYFSISTGMENITDQRYRPYSSGIAGAGRNFILGLNVKL